MRPARLALLLALALPSLAPAALPQEGPSLSVVTQPEYTVGDFWSYRVTQFGEGNVTAFQNQTVRVVELGEWNGTAAYRLFTYSEQAIPGDGGPRSTDLLATSNKTTWVSRAGLRLLHIEDATNRTQRNPLFTVLTESLVVWEFHQPMDIYQYPIVRDDVWVVVTDATLTETQVVYTHAQGNEPRRTNQTPRVQPIDATSATSWLREHRGLQTPAGTLDTVVLQSLSGNATVFDFYAPAVGNLVRREITNQTGAPLEISMLTGYRLARAPAGSPRPTPPGDGGPAAPSRDLLPLAGAAVVGVAVGLGAVAWWRRRPGPPAAAAPQEGPPPGDVPEGTAGGEAAPSGPAPGAPSDERPPG